MILPQNIFLYPMGNYTQWETPKIWSGTRKNPVIR